MVVLSKSISGYRFLVSLLLMKPELDIWNLGEYNGTFRENKLAFVAVLEYREKINLDKRVKENEIFLSNFLRTEIAPLSKLIEIR